MSVEFVDFSCGYTKKNIVLKDISLKCNRGEILCILGNNGIGKTTLIKSIFDVDRIIRGDILIDGKSIKDISQKERASIFAYVPQVRKNMFDLPVEEVIMMGRANYIELFGFPKDIDYKLVDDAMVDLGLTNLRGKKYLNLSGGEQQLVMIARAIVQQTQYIILDEPESNLDYKNRKKVMNVIRKLADNGIGVIVISHMPEMAIYWNSKIFMISNERRGIYGTIDEVFKEHILNEIYGIDIGIATVKNRQGIETKVLFMEEEN